MGLALSTVCFVLVVLTSNLLRDCLMACSYVCIQIHAARWRRALQSQHLPQARQTHNQPTSSFALRASSSAIAPVFLSLRFLPLPRACWPGWPDKPDEWRAALSWLSCEPAMSAVSRQCCGYLHLWPDSELLSLLKLYSLCKEKKRATSLKNCDRSNATTMYASMQQHIYQSGPSHQNAQRASKMDEYASQSPLMPASD